MPRGQSWQVAAVVGKIKIIADFLVFALVMSTAWQIAACELANVELKDDLKDMSAMNGARIGLSDPDSDEHLREAVIRRAAGYDIHLEPEQIVVRRGGTADAPTVFLATKYRRRVVMPGFTIIFHFSAGSRD